MVSKQMKNANLPLHAQKYTTLLTFMLACRGGLLLLIVEIIRRKYTNTAEHRATPIKTAAKGKVTSSSRDTGVLPVVDVAPLAPRVIMPCCIRRRIKFCSSTWSIIRFQTM